MRIVVRRALEPARDRLIAQDEARVVRGEHPRADRLDPELALDQREVLRPPGEEGPAGPDVEGPHIFLERRRRVVLRIERDRVEMHVAPHPRPDQLLHPAQGGGVERADVGAFGVDEVDRDDLALDHVIVEADLLAVLRDQVDVREIGLVPALLRRPRRPRQQEGGEQRGQRGLSCARHLP